MVVKSALDAVADMVAVRRVGQLIGLHALIVERREAKVDVFGSLVDWAGRKVV